MLVLVRIRRELIFAVRKNKADIRLVTFMHDRLGESETRTLAEVGSLQSHSYGRTQLLISRLCSAPSTQLPWMQMAE